MEEDEEIKVTISYPKVGTSGKTGTWRLFKPLIDEEKCNSCGLCYLYCPEGVISPEIDIDYEYCKGCGICENECPRDAITMVEETGESRKDLRDDLTTSED
ncbi:MAG: 4Fe-4S binding protein [Halobacteriota archaeon]|nr:4Fe-4S binding protein [Halobacteriota archaeon]